MKIVKEWAKHLPCKIRSKFIAEIIRQGRLNFYNTSQLPSLSETIWSAFSFYNSAEGHDFWVRIACRVQAIEANPKFNGHYTATLAGMPTPKKRGRPRRISEEVEVEETECFPDYGELDL